MEDSVLNLVFPSWKTLTLVIGMLVCGFFVGDAYRGAVENENDKALLRVSQSVDLDRASTLLIAMKLYSPDCARSMVHMSVEENLVRAKAMTVLGYSGGILDKSIMRAKKALTQQDKSGLGFSGGCGVPYK